MIRGRIVGLHRKHTDLKQRAAFLLVAKNGLPRPEPQINAHVKKYISIFSNY